MDEWRDRYGQCKEQLYWIWFYGSPANEYLATGEVAYRFRKFRNMFFELRLHEVIRELKTIYVDDNTAIQL